MKIKRDAQVLEEMGRPSKKFTEVWYSPQDRKYLKNYKKLKKNISKEDENKLQNLIELMGRLIKKENLTNDEILINKLMFPEVIQEIDKLLSEVYH